MTYIIYLRDSFKFLIKTKKLISGKIINILRFCQIPGKTPKKKININKSNKGKKKDLKTFSKEIAPKIDPSIRNKCLKCRGTKKLCGKQKCPVLAKYYNQLDTKKGFNTDELDGDSPPSVFVGRYNYPKINVGPMVPPEKGNTEIYSTPEKWFGEAEIDDIISFRGNLARGKKKLKKGVEVNKNPLSKEIEKTRYLTLKEEPTETEIRFNKKLRDNLSLDYKSQPYGPTGKIKELSYGASKTQRDVEKIFYDTDLKSNKAVKQLYNRDVPISKIQDVFMVGGTGLKKNRRFVPTRWAITAVDSIIGKDLREEVKKKRLIDNYEVYSAKYLDNQWLIIFTPTPWQYELIEAFYPETTWNPSGNQIAIFGDYEGLKGRDEYASLGGCYYSARLAVGEKLKQKNRQAGAIVLREARPGYILPVGVWLTRESVRNALNNKIREFDSKKKVLEYIDEVMDLELSAWRDVSELLDNKRQQKRLGDFF